MMNINELIKREEEKLHQTETNGPVWELIIGVSIGMAIGAFVAVAICFVLWLANKGIID